MPYTIAAEPLHVTSKQEEGTSALFEVNCCVFVSSGSSCLITRVGIAAVGLSAENYLDWAYRLHRIFEHEVTCVEYGDKALEYLGLMNCPLINESHVNVHHQHDDGDDSDERVDGDEHEHGNGHGHDDGDSMMFPHSLPLVNAHDQQEGQGTRVNICLEEGAEEFLLK
ncbi:Two-component response regulator ARR3 [Bienertia sinuspersici]